MKVVFKWFLPAALLVSYSLSAQEIGLQLYSLRNQFAQDPAGTMAKVKSFGVKNVEMAGTYGLQFPEFIKLLAQNDLQVISFGADFEKLEKFPQAVADEARAYGAKYVVCFWIPHEGDAFTMADVQHAAEVFNNAGKVMAQNGLLFCYHPHGYEFQLDQGKPLFDTLVKSLDPRFVYFELDVFWMKQAGQDPVALLRKYSSRWVMVHLKDRKAETPTSLNGKVDLETNVVLGKGDVGISAIMNEVKALGIQHCFVEDESSRAVEQIPLSLEYLKALNN